jgi:cytochrome b
MVLMLVSFRLLWGFVGTGSARFGQFVKGPRAVWAYVRPRGALPEKALGHNPLGGWSVLALLALLALMIVTGLFAVDVDGLESGPLSYLVSFDQGRAAAELHEFSFNLLLAMVALHVGAILFYLVVKRRNLTAAMITGFESMPAAASPVPVRRVAPWRALIALAIAFAFTYAVANGLRF